jgi:hypothetical protein
MKSRGITITNEKNEISLSVYVPYLKNVALGRGLAKSVDHILQR